jgi:exonuclease SbcC
MPSTSSDNIPDRNELDQQKMVISTLETEIEKSILEQKQLEQQIENVKVSISTVLSSVHKSLFHEENSKPERAALSAGIQDRLNELQNHFAQANNTKANIEKLETRREDLASKLKQLSAKCKELQIDFQSTNETYSGKLAILEQTLEQLNLNGYEEKPSNWALALTIDNTELKRKLDKARNFLQILLAAHENAQNEYMEAEKLYSSIEGKCQSLCNHLNEYKNNLDSSAEILNKQLTELGFKSQEDLSTKIRKPDDIENEELIIKEFQSKFQSAKDRYTRAQNEAANLERQNLETLRENLDQTRKLIEDLAVSKGQLENQNSQITKTIEHIESIENKLLAFQDNYKTIGHLAQIANGKNSLGITFQRFVLTSLLDDILVSASQRLNMMSRGRYTLQRSLQRSDRRKSFGLDLEIFDAYTGNQRNVSTLSGGESFLAALSLALGLSDVVQAYSGGIKLDTIFIDEGFGSLDPESLDLAMRALMDLQKEGRLVGIISHVPELKERIDTRLEIVAGSNGSKTKLFS